MYNEVFALIASFIALVFVVFAYFTSKKNYLMFQSLCIVFLIISYFFKAQYFVAIGMVVSLGRSLTFYYFESKDKDASIFWSFLFSALTITSYFIVNLVILGDAKLIDIICLCALVLYSFIFRIRNLKIVRFTMLIPTALSIIYNIVAAMPIFAILSYSFELGANIVSIVKYDVLPNRKKKTNENV